MKIDLIAAHIQEQKLRRRLIILIEFKKKEKYLHSLKLIPLFQHADEESCLTAYLRLVEIKRESERDPHRKIDKNCNHENRLNSSEGTGTGTAAEKKVCC